MRRTEVPTHLMVEDKLVSNITNRQFVILALGTLALYSIWTASHIDIGSTRLLIALPARIGAMIITALLALSMAYIKVIYYAEVWAQILVTYWRLPKVTVWKRIQTAGVEVTPRDIDAALAEIVDLNVDDGLLPSPAK